MTVRVLVSATAMLLGVIGALAAQPSHRFLRKPTDAAIRVMTWNIYRDSIFPPDGEAVDATAANRPAQFARILKALAPDVLCLQQVTVGAARSAALVDEILPLPDGQTWQAHDKVDTVIVSRFKLRAIAEGQVDGERIRGHSIALIGTPATDLYLICAHFESSNEREDVLLRREQARVIVNTIREAKAGTGPIPLRTRTPFVVIGDFNAITGATLFVDAIVSGRAPYETGGPAERPDWDRTALTDAQPRHNGSGTDRYTWRNDVDRFPPGILDRIFYSDSVLRSVNQFVLDTTVMSYRELVDAGLRSIDVMRDPQAGIHDHLPVVIDFVPRRR
jgi:endonuclease/exonuclease/phosphatase family metal-dependent hydrolase